MIDMKPVAVGICFAVASFAMVALLTTLVLSTPGQHTFL